MGFHFFVMHIALRLGRIYEGRTEQKSALEMCSGKKSIDSRAKIALALHASQIEKKIQRTMTAT